MPFERLEFRTLTAQQPNGNCYVTHFDAGYAVFGLAMLRSLCRYDTRSRVLVVGMDARVRTIVAADVAIADRVEVVEVEELEEHFAVLRRLRGERSWREYCWTLTPFLLQYAMETGRGRTMATYVDADLYFFASPVQLLEDLRAGDRHVVLTDHDYVPSRDLRGESGRFCVQFLPVRNSELGGSFVDWWRDLCIDSCSEVATPEVFGDQKYLDRAPGLFGDAVRVESGEGKFLGPWNALRLRRSSSRPIAYHFHGLRSIAGRMVLRSGEWRLGAARRLYREYEQELSKVLRDNTSLRLPRTSLTVRSCAVLLRRGLPIGLLPSGSTS